MAATEHVASARFPRWSRPVFRPKRYKVMYGGRGAGRSWAVARALLILGADRRPAGTNGPDDPGEPGLRVLCARELQKSIKDSVHRLLADQIALLGLPYEVLQSEIRHPNGTLFIFEGLRQNATKIKSIEGIDICWVEEAERVSAESWKILIPTIRKDGSEIWITFNPDLETDPTYSRFVLNTPPDTWLCPVNGEDNPWFPDTLRVERDYLRRVDPDAAAHVWDGQTRQATDAQILRGKWIVEEFEPVTDADLPEEMGPEERRGLVWDGPYHGADFGFAADPATLVKLWIYRRVLYVEREAYRIGLDTDEMPAFWMEQVPGCEKYVIRADSSRPDTISYLKRHGLPHVEGAPKGAGSVEDGIAFLRQFERIVIHPRCKHTADEARHYSYKRDRRTGDVLPEILDANNHCIDGIRYALAPLIRQRSAPGVWGWDS